MILTLCIILVVACILISIVFGEEGTNFILGFISGTMIAAAVYAAGALFSGFVPYDFSKITSIGCILLTLWHLFWAILIAKETRNL